MYIRSLDDGRTWDVMDDRGPRHKPVASCTSLEAANAARRLLREPTELPHPGVYISVPQFACGPPPPVSELIESVQPMKEIPNNAQFEIITEATQPTYCKFCLIDPNNCPRHPGE